MKGEKDESKTEKRTWPRQRRGRAGWSKNHWGLVKS